MGARLIPRSAVTAVVSAVVAMAVSLPLHAQVASINPAFPTCIPEKGNAVVSAVVTPQTGWATVRTYFRKVGSRDWYWVEARNEGKGTYWGVLPRAADYTQAVEMQIIAKDADGKETKSPIKKTDVTSDCKPVMTAPQSHMAQNLVVGETIVEQRDQEILGFVCPGVISRVDHTGELKPDEYCRKAAIVAAAFPAESLLIPALAALGGAGVTYAIVEDCECDEKSPSRP